MLTPDSPAQIQALNPSQYAGWNQIQEFSVNTVIKMKNNTKN